MTADLADHGSGGPAGLSTREAARLLVSHGPNTIAAERRVPLWHRVLQQLRDPLILVLLAAATLTIATNDLADTSIIMLVVIVNTVVGVAQEIKAERAVAALRALSAPVARVVRDSQERYVPSAEVVPGDLLLLAEGDIVPADGVVLEAARLLIDESSVTGESEPVEKTAVAGQAPTRTTPVPVPEGDGPPASAPDGPRPAEPSPAGTVSAGTVSAGTVVVRGRGRVSVTATGADSATGRIAALLRTGPGLTPLQRRLAAFGRVLAAAVVVLCALVLLLGLLRGQPWDVMVVTALSLAVAAVPESLPAVVTLSLALGARRMVARRAIVRRLPAVETLGSVTVLATDKTGTLTEGRMAAEALWTPETTAVVTGTGYAPEGRVLRDGRTVTAEEAPDLAALLEAAVLCNDAGLQPPGDDDRPSWLALGDPTEAALLTAGARLGLHRTVLERAWPRVDEVPFDSSRKRMTTVHRGPDGSARVISKGAPEVMLTAHVLTGSPEELARAVTHADRLAADGYRVLAVAADTLPGDVAGTGAAVTGPAGADTPGPPTAGTEPGPVDGWESGRLGLLGLVGILDPPRAAAAATLEACTRAGIIPVLITGDHPLTARAVVRRLGIADGDRVVTGEQIRSGEAGDLTEARIFARTSPEQKLDIVQAWRAAGHVVAMTGDGVNDGPALRRADIGVAMGRRGTEVARQSADLVLADDDLGTVVAAVEEGRRVYSNVRRFLLYGISGGAAEVAVMLIGPFLGMPLPLLPAQILWINLLTHGLPGVALGAEPGGRDVMRDPPRPPGESVLGAGLWPRVLLMGTVIAAVTLAAGVWAHQTDRPWQTMVFLVLGATQLGVALGSRARPGTWSNPFLLVAVATALALQIAGVYFPPLRALLGTEPLALTELLIACALSVVGYAAMRLQRWLLPEHTAGRRPGSPSGPADAPGSVAVAAPVAPQPNPADRDGGHR
ncbi:cation-transporting P-type ATPase [Streptomyces sp. ACA25]|uniref:cation-translocating P-type ATPase n=1 Tax=Streptomyces sp. ACA25 TaxID=3022596 RepID=UPI002307F16F|nr:cation-transporting P-type ATPase [Streptomyces sp. ACA25]MDB1087339.1 cation-transporting P-type ATPase [Streptomyces sp. ACA25]